MPEVESNNMIAVGHSESYQLISSSDLQNCNKLGDTYFCKVRNVLLKDLTKTCLGALYLADHTNIQARCKFTVDGAQGKIFRLDSHTYVVENQHQSSLSKGYVYLSSTDLIRTNNRDQP
jgi:hypothetical protein